jgi:hypothetical protein
MADNNTLIGNIAGFRNSGLIASAVDLQDRIVDKYFTAYATRIAFVAYAFVFGYYGFLKVQALFTGLSTPVRGEVGHLVTILGLPEFGMTLTVVMGFIGVYEMTLGLIFAFKKLRLAVPLFLSHQVVTLITLVIGRAYYFQEPFLFGVPWLFDAFAAYILKNTIFIGGFLILAAVELSDKPPARTIRSENGSRNRLNTDVPEHPEERCVHETQREKPDGENSGGGKDGVC